MPSVVTTVRVLCPKTLRLTKRVLPARPPVGHLRVKVQYAGLNRPDLLQLEGRYPPPPGVTDVPGLELSGVVVDQNDCRPQTQQLLGRQVMALVPGGAFAQLVDVPQDACLPVPRKVSLPEAAGLLESFVTAHMILQLSGAVTGASILVHAAASGVGSALLQMAKHLRAAEIVAVVGKASKVPFVQRLGATSVINRTQSEEVKYLRLVPNNSLDVVWDCVGSSLAAEHVRVCRPDAVWVLYGILGGTRPVPFSFAQMLQKRIQLRTTTLRSRSDAHRKQLLSSFANSVLPEFENDKYKVHVHKTYSWSDAATALDELRSNANLGKIILSLDECS